MAFVTYDHPKAAANKVTAYAADCSYEAVGSSKVNAAKVRSVSQGSVGMQVSAMSAMHSCSAAVHTCPVSHRAAVKCNARQIQQRLKQLCNLAENQLDK